MCIRDRICIVHVDIFLTLVTIVEISMTMARSCVFSASNQKLQLKKGKGRNHFQNFRQRRWNLILTKSFLQQMCIRDSAHSGHKIIIIKRSFILRNSKLLQKFVVIFWLHLVMGLPDYRMTAWCQNWATPKSNTFIYITKKHDARARTLTHTLFM